LHASANALIPFSLKIDAISGAGEVLINLSIEIPVAIFWIVRAIFTQVLSSAKNLSGSGRTATQKTEMLQRSYMFKNSNIAMFSGQSN
jgi:hypothetical protein